MLGWGGGSHIPINVGRHKATRAEEVSRRQDEFGSQIRRFGDSEPCCRGVDISGHRLNFCSQTQPGSDVNGNVPEERASKDHGDDGEHTLDTTFSKGHPAGYQLGV